MVIPVEIENDDVPETKLISGIMVGARSEEEGLEIVEKVLAGLVNLNPKSISQSTTRKDFS